MIDIPFVGPEDLPQPAEVLHQQQARHISDARVDIESCCQHPEQKSVFDRYAFAAHLESALAAFGTWEDIEPLLAHVDWKEIHCRFADQLEQDFYTARRQRAEDRLDRENFLASPLGIRMPKVRRLIRGICNEYLLELVVEQWAREHNARSTERIDPLRRGEETGLQFGEGFTFAFSSRHNAILFRGDRREGEFDVIVRVTQGQAQQYYILETTLRQVIYRDKWKKAKVLQKGLTPESQAKTPCTVLVVQLYNPHLEQQHDAEEPTNPLLLRLPLMDTVNRMEDVFCQQLLQSSQQATAA